MNAPRKDNGYCNAALCHQKYRFEWRGRRGCESNFVCSRLDGNVCGDFGVALSYGLTGVQLSSRRDAEVCQAGRAHRGNVTDGRALEIQLWYRRGAQFQVECFMWCTPGGRLPANPHGPPVDVTTVISLGSELREFNRFPICWAKYHPVQ